jgi:cell division protein FtsB
MASVRVPTIRSEKAPVRLHAGRLALLVLLLVGAAFYVQPLRAFFAQQDRYLDEAAVLDQARTENVALREQVVHLKTRDYITRQAREEFQLAPAGMQVFVVKGLPEAAVRSEGSQQPAPVVEPPTLPERLRDLWQTLRR